MAILIAESNAKYDFSFLSLYSGTPGIKSMKWLTRSGKGPKSNRSIRKLTMDVIRKKLRSSAE